MSIVQFADLINWLIFLCESKGIIPIKYALLQFII